MIIVAFALYTSYNKSNGKVASKFSQLGDEISIPFLYKMVQQHFIIQKKHGLLEII